MNQGLPATDAATAVPTLGLVIVAHAPAASGLAALVKHLDAAWLGRIAAFDMPTDLARDEAARRIAALTVDRGWPECLVLVDLAGAGPFHAARLAVESLRPRRARIVTGINAPMLCSLLAHGPFPDLDGAARYARSRGRRGITLHGAVSGSSRP